MAKYRVLNQWFDGVKVRVEGEEVEYHGEPGPSLEPLDAEAKRAAAAAAKRRDAIAAAQAKIPLPDGVLTVSQLAGIIGESQGAAPQIDMVTLGAVVSQAVVAALQTAPQPAPPPTPQA